ncbi:solute carrier family 45 member 3 [Leucoraja erinacea]|uniref:solute carrier family 45 member 3 n=1 Tax=Leucoraja erinaceus TaxID=7782 RepID=UPI00245746BB|nr:solute carrier family 45 member 3 [Leucoraja erinacea]XP_055510929.1 solute carrier family 45 member 3 [Leucoraja erinacea]
MEKPQPNLLSHKKRSQLLLLNMLTCGLEICVAAGITFVPPLLLKAEVQEKYMTMVLGIGPVLGLIFVPMIGSASDHWTSRYGRRRPFIWGLCLGVLLSLFIIPHASRLAAAFSPKDYPADVIFLIVGICMLDFCGQVCFTPLEALLSDLFHDTEECRRAFSMYSFMISLGGCIGYLLMAIDWRKTFLSSYLGEHEDCLFSLLAAIFLVCVCATFFVTEETYGGPDALADLSPKEAVVIKPLARRSCCCGTSALFRARHSVLVLRNCCTLIPKLYHLYYRIPRVTRHLVVAEFYSWMALMTFMMFYTDFVGEGLYQGVPNAAPGSEARRRYDDGVRMGSIGLFLQCAFSIFCSTIMDRLVTRFGSKTVYLASIAFFTATAIVMCLSKSVVLVTAMSALTGFTYSTLQILPYTLNSLYHKEKQVFFCKHKSTELADANCQGEKKTPSQNGILNHKSYNQNGSLIASGPLLPSKGPLPDRSLRPQSRGSQCEVVVSADVEAATMGRGICLDLAILDSAFLLSQVIPSLLMGTIVQFTQTVNAYMISAATFGMVAIYFATKVVFDKNDLEKYLA